MGDAVCESLLLQRLQNQIGIRFDQIAARYRFGGVVSDIRGAMAFRVSHDVVASNAITEVVFSAQPA